MLISYYPTGGRYLPVERAAYRTVPLQHCSITAVIAAVDGKVSLVSPIFTSHLRV